MKTVLLILAAVIGVGIVLVCGHFAFIEIGREVATLRTPLPGGAWRKTRLWVVDHDGAAWLHSAGQDWMHRFDGDPVVELERQGVIRRYKAHADPGSHPIMDRLLREKYGLADRWVRFLAPCTEDMVPVRLDPIEP